MFFFEDGRVFAYGAYYDRRDLAPLTPLRPRITLITLFARVVSQNHRKFCSSSSHKQERIIGTEASYRRSSVRTEFRFFGGVGQ